MISFHNIYTKLFLFIFLFNIAIRFTHGQVTPHTERVIFSLKNEAIPREKASEKAQASGCNPVDEVNFKYKIDKMESHVFGPDSEPSFRVAQFPKGTDIHSVISELAALEEVEFAEPDFIAHGGSAAAAIPNDAFYYRQWSLNNKGTFSLAQSKKSSDIDMQNAWQVTQGDSNIIVGIIDSGLKLDHPEFADRIWKNYKEIANNGIDDDKNGYIDDVQGWDFVNSDNDPGDDFGHGTNVAGILGATGNNSIGYAGMDWKCKLMALKGLDSTNSGYYSMWIDAIYYAVNQGAKVLNMSLGGTSNSTALQKAINYALSKNVVVVACMMNTNSATTYYAAGFPGVIAVGSTDPDDQRSSPFFWSATSGSNYGKHISVVAPGNYIYGLNHQSDTNFNYYWGGTSQATPHVAGLASLLLSLNPGFTPAQIKSIIEKTAIDQVGNPAEDTPGWDQYYGYGRINAYKALLTTAENQYISINSEVFRIYPNPSQNHFFVSFPNNTNEVRVINSSGQVLIRKRVSGKTSEQFSLDKNGVYLIQAELNNQTITKKMVIHQ